MVTFTFLAVEYVIIILTLPYSFLSLREGLEGGGGIEWLQNQVDHIWGSY